MAFIRRGREEFSNYTIFEVVIVQRLVSGMTWGCGEQPLKVAFLELFSIACSRDAFVVDLQFFNGSTQWNVNL